MMMRFEIDTDVNALSVQFNEGEVDRTIEVNESMFIDLDEQGNTLGFEFLDADDFMAFIGRHGGKIGIPERVNDVTEDLRAIAD